MEKQSNCHQHRASDRRRSRCCWITGTNLKHVMTTSGSLDFPDQVRGTKYDGMRFKIVKKIYDSCRCCCVFAGISRQNAVMRRGLCNLTTLQTPLTCTYFYASKIPTRINKVCHLREIRDATFHVAVHVLVNCIVICDNAVM